MKINADIEFKNGDKVNFTVNDVYEGHLKEFLLLNYLSPSKIIYDNYLAYVPELMEYSGEDIKKAILKNIVLLKKNE